MDSITNDNDNNTIDETQKPLEEKPLTYTPGFYKRLSNWYYSKIDKYNLRKITDPIDKIMPSMIFFSILVLIILIVIILVIIFSMGPSLNEYSLSLTLNGKPYLDDYTISLSGTNVSLITPNKTKSETKFMAEENVFVNAKVTIGKNNYNKSFKTDNQKIILNIVSASVSDLDTKVQKENLFSFALITPNGTLDKSGTIKASCDGFSQDYPIDNGLLNNVKISCKTVSVTANVEGLPPVNQMCNPGLCKINMSDNLSTKKIETEVITNKLVIYVNNKDGSSAQGILVEVREDSVGQELVDSGKTKDFGSYTIDLLQGDYIVNVSDPSGKFASMQKKVKVTAGNQDPLIFVLDLPSIGNISISFKVEDSNILSGVLYFKDVNNNILQTKTFDTNVSVNFPISAKGTYNISAKLNNQYMSDYISEDVQVNYDLESGDKSVLLNIRKMNPFTDQNVIVQVTELQTGKPIPFAKIYFTNLSKQNEFMQSIGFVNADAQGYYSLILPKGDYSVILDHFSLTGKAVFYVIETKSLTLTSTNVNLRVDWGNSKLNICLFDGKKTIDNAVIELYSIERGLEWTGLLEPGKNCIPVDVKSLENVYVHVIKQGYYDLYSPTYFMLNNTPKDVSLNLTEIVNVNPITELQTEFLGVYSDDTLSTLANKITGPTDTSNGEYYYAFKVKLPKFKAVTNNKLNFYGIAGNKIDENIDLSKVVAEYVQSIGNTSLYSNYNADFNIDSLKISELDNETNKYKAKSFLSSYTFDKDVGNDTEIIFTVLVRLTNNIVIDPYLGENIFFWYDFTLNNDKPKFESILKKAGTQYCDNPVCIDAYMGAYEITNSSNVPAKGNIWGKIYFNNSDTKNLIIYNKASDAEDKKESIKEMDVALNNGIIISSNIFGKLSADNLNIGPIYYDKSIDAEYADFNFDYELISKKDSAITFRVYDGFWQPNDNNKEDIKINIEETEPLTVTGLPEFIVPFVSNKIILSVDAKDNVPAVNAEVKYYTKGSGNWILNNTYYTSNSGNVEINTIPLGIGDKTKIVIYLQGYKPYVSDVLNADFDFMKANDSEIDIKYPEADSVSPANKEVNVTNESAIDVNVFNVNYYLDITSIANPDFVDKFLNIKDMQNHFIGGRTLSSNTKLPLYIVYDSNLLLQNARTVNIDETVSFNFSPISANAQMVLSALDVELYRIFNTKMEFGFEGKPDGEIQKCIFASVEPVTGNNPTDAATNNENKDIVFLEGLPTNTYVLKIVNGCTLQQGQQIDFTKLDLSLSGNALNNLVVIGKSQGNNNTNDDFTYNSLTNTITLINGAKNGIHYYDLNFIILPGFEINQSKNLEFNFTPYYRTTLNDLNEAAYDDMNSVQVTIRNSDFSECLKFGLPNDGQNYDVYKMNYSQLTSNADLTDDFLRLPYNLKKQNTTTLGYGTYGAVPGAQQTNQRVNSNFKYDGYNLGLVEQDGIFEYSTLPLQIKNECGIKLNYAINFISGYLYNDLSSYISNNTINPNQQIIFKLSRDTPNYSGAVVLGLSVQNPITNQYEPIKSLKINVESSANNPNMVVNPFYLDKNNISYDWKVYNNNYKQIGPINESHYNDSVNPKEYLDSAKTAKWNEYPWGEVLPWFENIGFEQADSSLTPPGYIEEMSGNNNYYACSNYMCGNDQLPEPFYNAALLRYDHDLADYLYYNNTGDSGSSGIFAKFAMKGYPKIDIYNLENQESKFFNDWSSYISYQESDLTNLDFMSNGVLQQDYEDLVKSVNPPLIGYILLVGSGTSTTTDNEEDNISAYCASGYEPKFVATSVNNEDYSYLDNFYFTNTDSETFNAKSNGGNCGWEMTKTGIILYCRLNDSSILNYSLDYPRGYTIDKSDLIDNQISVSHGNVNLFDLSTLPTNTFANSMPECNGGFTGLKYKPNVDYSSSDVGVCIVSNSTPNIPVNACSLKSFANLIANNNKDKTTMQVKLMHDNYTKENLMKMQNEFLSKLNAFDIVYLDGSPVGELSPGVYNVSIENKENKDENVRVYISYSSFILPDHLFYYMPYDGTADNYGTSTSSSINLISGYTFPLAGSSGSTKGLDAYSVTSESFDRLNSVGSSLGLVLQGDMKNKLLNYNELSITIASMNLQANEVIDLSFTYNNAKVISDTLLQNWFVYQNGELVYPSTVGIKITAKSSNEITITNTTDNTFTLKRTFFVPKQGIFYSNNTSKVMLTPINKAISSMQDIIGGISSGNICYKKDADNYYYYYSINNIQNN